MTPYEDVFKAFLNKIQDNLYVELTEADTIEDLTGLLNSAITYFSYPKVDIRDKDDDGQYFNVTLGIDEIEILVLGMLIEWMKRELRSVDALRQSMTTKDFNTYSQASHINALVKASAAERAELKRKLVRYSVRGADGTSQFSVLGGD